MKIKRFLAITFALMLTFSLVACGSGDSSTSSGDGEPAPPEATPPPTETPASTPEPTPMAPQETLPAPEPAPEPTPEPFEPVCPLSGRDMEIEQTRKRPVAVVLSNQGGSLPMNGVGSADIVYEYLVEGGTTRMLGIYQDFSNVPMVGSIRSARVNVVEIVEGYDAMFIHHGGNIAFAYPRIRERGITNFDGIGDTQMSEGGSRSGIFYRNENRISGRTVAHLHSQVTTGSRFEERLPDYAQRDNLRTEHSEDFRQRLRFSDNATPVNGSDAGEAVVRYSAGKTSSFIYSEPEQGYFMRQFNSDFRDANGNFRPVFANVLVIKTTVTLDNSTRDTLYFFETTGSGDGYFLHGGKYIEIKWSRENETSPYGYTKLDGTPLELGRGSTFICIIPTTQDVVFS